MGHRNRDIKKGIYGDPGLVTVNTDASFFREGETGGYAFWIKSNQFTMKGSGQFRGRVVDPNEAEIKALVNALDYLERNTGVKFSTLVVNCDNAAVRGIINKRTVNKRFEKKGNMLLGQLERFTVSYAKVIRGHRKEKSARHWVNNWCDSESRSYIKK